MAAPIEFLFEFASPYSCIAARRIGALGRPAWPRGGMTALRVFDADHTGGRDMSAAESVVQRDVIGAPFFFVDGEPFWGNDRIEQIRRMAAARRLVRRNPWQA